MREGKHFGERQDLKKQFLSQRADNVVQHWFREQVAQKIPLPSQIKYQTWGVHNAADFSLLIFIFFPLCVFLLNLYDYFDYGIIIHSQSQYLIFMRIAIPALVMLLISLMFGTEGFQLSAADLGVLSNATNLLWPLPRKLSQDEGSEPLQLDICDVVFRVSALPPDIILRALDIYLVNVLGCSYVKIADENQQRSESEITMYIVVRNTSQMVAQSIEHEEYSLTIRQTNSWDLIANYYVGFMRGLQTFSQLFQKKPHSDHFIIRNRPIVINDKPDLLHRGLMIDTSRHFLSVAFIKHAIDGLMYSKLNVLHWHVCDQDSFPMVITDREELSLFGAVGGIYTLEEVDQIVSYARIRGIRVIPEFDSPAHTRSWGLSPALQSIAMRCHEEYQGQFDPTIDLTYEVIKDVLIQSNKSFPDSYIHLGGDQVQTDCWEDKPHIKQFMVEHNISSYEDLQVYYRRRQKKLLRQITDKKAIYWANEEINLPVEHDDIIQWWGESQNIDQLKERHNPIILSYYDLAYLDTGYGDQLGEDYRVYVKWRQIYERFQTDVEGVNILGGEACIWSELTNQGNFDQKVWPRAAVIGEKLWNNGLEIKEDGILLNAVRRLLSHTQRLKERGFKPEPVTVGLCEKDPTICFS